MSFNISNILLHLIWVTFLILITLAQDSFTIFEWLVLVLLSLIGYTMVYDKLWFEEDSNSIKRTKK